MAFGTRTEPREKLCSGCGTTFTPKQSMQKYCSSPCANAATALRRGGKGKPRPQRRNRVRRNCDHCGTSFERTAGDTKRGQGRYCSRECFYAALRSDSIDGEKARASDYRHTFNLRLKGETRCRCCSKRAAHLHHAVPRSLSRQGCTDLRNGLPLCPTCHQGWHYRTLTIYRDAFEPEELVFIRSLTDTGRNIDAWLDDRYPERCS